MITRQEYTEEIKRLLNAELSEEDRTNMIAELSIEYLRNVHSRALGCHCICLAFNAENSLAVMLGKSIPYGDIAYFHALKKWGLMDDDNNPTI